MQSKSSFILGISLVLGMFTLGYILGGSLLKFKEFERTVKVKGLSQKEVKADIVLWPIQYLRAENNLTELYSKLEKDTKSVEQFLLDSGFDSSEISISAPAVIDKMAQSYGSNEKIQYRYSATQTLTIYTSKVDKALKSMTLIAKLGKSGITFRTNSYENKTEFIYTKLNDIKPKMIEEATSNARSSAQKFAEDSQSKLGKIKSASQGQFSIVARDKYTPYIKNVRVVSTIEYYLND